MKISAKELLLECYNAFDGEKLQKIVDKHGLDAAEYWKPYGGNKNNAGTFENQQSSPENALVEKITNAIDAILMKKCYVNGVNPRAKDDSVPKTMEEAIKTFFGVKDGKWENVTDKERKQAASNIQLLITGDRKTPNVAIYDTGEGQNPSDFPNTLLSIARGNKNDIPFVQGKYNFGSTGAVVFCGEKYRYQLIISRRSTELTDGDGMIGFTLVRRHILTPKEEQEVKLTWYEYLTIDGEIPQFKAESLELGLDGGLPYESGTIVKMYSYQLTRPSNATLDLWRELNPLLFVSALPILICEQRDFAGHSPTKTMLGNRTRLAVDSNENITFEKDMFVTAFNSKIPIHVYVFNRDVKNPEFIGGKSVIYLLNGQTQGFETKSFISQEIGLRNLREYMLVCVDCTNIGTAARQELFMASRDRLKQGRNYTELKDDIISLLKADEDLSKLDQEYRGKAFKESGEDKDLIESFFSQLKTNKDIRNMFSGNNGVFSFFSKKMPKAVEKKPDKPQKEKETPKLQHYPSIFKVKGFDKDDEEYIKAIKKGGRGKIVLETDVENDFFSRSDDYGSLEITTLDYDNNGGQGGGYHLPTVDNTKIKVQVAGPHDGEIQVFIEPKDEVEIGENIKLSLKMISPIGEHEVIVSVKIDKPNDENKEKEKKKEEEIPEVALPQLVRVVEKMPSENEHSWADEKMTGEDIVKLSIASDGSVEAVLINMDSNLVKKKSNERGVNIERLRAKYLRTMYSHALMMYTTLYGYYEKGQHELENHIVKEIEDNLNEAIRASFKYYGNFLLTFEELSD